MLQAAGHPFLINSPQQLREVNEPEFVFIIKRFWYIYIYLKPI